MAARNRPLTAAQADRYGTALGLLQAGRSAQAVAIAEALAGEAPLAADAQQLLGMSRADAGDVAGAEAAFRRALELAPDSTVVALNFAAWLCKAGRLPDAARVLAAAPESAQTKLQQGLVALQMRDHALAREACERATRLQPDAATAWHGLGNALRALDDLESAAAAFRKATALAPRHAPAWANLGAVLRLLGRIDEALACLRRAESLGHAGPELKDAIDGVLQDAGRPAEALEGARKLVAAHPDYAPGHETLANLLWEHGPELAPQQDPLQAFRAAAHAQPGNRALRLRFVRMLLSARRAGEAAALLEQMRRGQDDPVLDWLSADALEALGQRVQAAALYARAERRLGGASADFLNAYARHAFRAGDFERAQACAAQAVRIDPASQEAWSHLGTAWRLVGDPREHWLFDYERLVGYVEVAPPPGFADMSAFLADLGRTLEAMHLAGREPINQSVRNGSQTPGRLFGRSEPAIRAAEAALRAAVEGWLATLPDDPAHPFLSRKRRGVRFVGSWSVRLKSSGRHSNHIHNEGWMSSAFYVALPGAVRDGPKQAHAGWIQFGQPLEELGLDLPPRRTIRPRPGHLALFPSYTWHGTVPFTDVEPRVTIAFDMQPC
ncbi:MAG: tetratricopeptide repeat protein [Pseudoxanthomonas sp.]